jgi:putative hydrolase of the HAD superfamily
MRSCKAVLFDLDETLIDRSASLEQYTRRFLERFGDDLAARDRAALLAKIVAADGGGYRPRAAVFACLRDALPWRVVPAIAAVAEHWQRMFPASSVLRDEAVKVLETLSARDMPLGLVTNGSLRAQDAKIRHLGLARYFKTIVISEAVGCAKPDAAIFAHALSALGVAPERALFVGGHPVNDVQGASRAGLISVWLEGVHDWPAGVPEHALRIRKLGQLLALPELRD